MSDEPARPDNRIALFRRIALVRAEVRVRTAAQAWRARIDDTGPDRPGMWADQQDFELIAAVDAYNAAQTAMDGVST